MRQIEIAGVKETVYERSDFPPDKLKAILGRETVGVIGYGRQGHAQALNLRDNGVRVLVCEIPGPNYDRAVQDGFRPGETLFQQIPEAVRRATVVMYLLTDAGQKANWGLVGPNLKEGAALYFSHGFSIVYRDQTGVVPPPNVDVILVAPKGSGNTVRRLFLEGRGINCSFAVHQDFTGRARERCLALGIGVGCGFLFETTFQKEVFSDLVGERGVLMGALYGIFRAQYELLRAKGHSPAEAFNETVEEATQSLYPQVGENGMDWMYSNCSTTAQRGALNWYKRFEAAARPVFEELYEKVATGVETRHVLEAHARPNYAEELKGELAGIRNDEIWQIGAIVRELRPERQPAAANAAKPAPRAKPGRAAGRPKARRGAPKARPAARRKVRAKRRPARRR